HLAAMQIVFPQNETQRLNNEKIAATRVSKNVSPTAGLLDPVAAPPRDRRTAPCIDNDSLAASKRRGEAGIAIVSGDDFRGWPNFSAKMREYGPIFRATAGEKNSRSLNLSWQLRENGAQAIKTHESEICRWQFALIHNAQLIVIVFCDNPGGFCSAPFDAEDLLAGVHDPLYLADS